PPQLSQSPIVDILRDGAVNTSGLTATLRYALSQSPDPLFVRAVLGCKPPTPRTTIRVAGDALVLQVRGADSAELADAVGEAVRWLTMGIGNEQAAFDAIIREWLHLTAEVAEARAAVQEAVRRASAS
ncbi:MAG TPA: hypothetical protein VIR58_20195, partial [Acidimicrobiales bacterium]